MSKQILVGVIISAHGTRGQLKIKPFSEDFRDLTTVEITDQNLNSYKINVLNYDKNKNLICSIDGIVDRNEAEKLLKTELYISRSSLKDTKEGEYYVSDLIGLDVCIEDNKLKGKCTNMYNFGAGEILEYKTSDEKKHLIGFNNTNISNVDLKNKKIHLRCNK